MASPQYDFSTAAHAERAKRQLLSSGECVRVSGPTYDRKKRTYTIECHTRKFTIPIDAPDYIQDPATVLSGTKRYGH
jgi:hypothetical protein